VNLRFESPWDAINAGEEASWSGGFLQVFFSFFTNVRRHGVIGQTAVGTAWIAHFIGNYADGENSPAIFQVNGLFAGGIIANNWMQAAITHRCSAVSDSRRGVPRLADAVASAGHLADRPRQFVPPGETA
jgi:hypothetical protein